MKTSYLLSLLLLFLCLLTFGQKDNAVQFSDISIDTMGMVKWTATYIKDPFSLEFVIERWANNKWRVVGGFGGSFNLMPEPSKVTTDSFSSPVKFHKGINTYRIRMTYPSVGTSAEFELKSKVSNDDGSLWIAGCCIFLENKEYYEIINSNASTVQKGEDQTIDISTLPAGNYYFYTKSFTRQFVK